MVGCDKDENNNSGGTTTPAPGIFMTTNGTFSTISLGELRVSTNPELSFDIDAGDNLIFEFQDIHGLGNEIIDDEFMQKIVFEIDAELDFFEFRNEELRDIKCIHEFSGAWHRHTIRQIEEGSIRGTKISPQEWNVSASLIVHYYSLDRGETLEFNKTFRY